MPTTVRPLFVRYAVLKLGIPPETGTTTFTSFECEATSIGITSEGGDTQSLTTLCPDGAFSEASPRTYNLTVTIAQDVENIDSFLFWLLQHDAEVADFQYYPKADGDGAPVGYGFKGQVTVGPPDTIGGAESGSYATTDVTLPMVGKYTLVDDAGAEVTPTP